MNRAVGRNQFACSIKVPDNVMAKTQAGARLAGVGCRLRGAAHRRFLEPAMSGVGRRT